MARPEGIEPPTLCLEGRRSIRLSYGRAAHSCNPTIEQAMTAFGFTENLLLTLISFSPSEYLQSPGCGIGIEISIQTNSQQRAAYPSLRTSPVMCNARE